MAIRHSKLWKMAHRFMNRSFLSGIPLSNMTLFPVTSKAKSMPGEAGGRLETGGWRKTNSFTMLPFLRIVGCRDVCISDGTIHYCGGAEVPAFPTVYSLQPMACFFLRPDFPLSSPCGFEYYYGSACICHRNNITIRGCSQPFQPRMDANSRECFEWVMTVLFLIVAHIFDTGTHIGMRPLC